MTKIPEFIKKRVSLNDDFTYLKDLLKTYNIKTVCENAICPNIYDCYSKKYASFLILGNVCTRSCKFCGVSKGIPEPVDEKEPERIAEVIKKLDMRYVVITSVTRDDLPDGGANQYKRVVEEIRRKTPHVKIELLIPDFKGNPSHLKTIFNSNPDVISHNIETVRSLYSIIRPGANYNTSLKILEEIKKNGFITKSGFMIGLGEKEKEIYEVIEDIFKTGCDIIVIGQYLKPHKSGYEVKKYYDNNFFMKLKEYCYKIGFKKIYAGIFYRSSYLAERYT